MRKVFIVLSLMIFFGLSNLANARGTAIGFRFINTLGISAELTHTVYQEKLNARLGFNYLSLSYKGIEPELEYELDMKLKSLLLTLDYHPWQKKFRLSGGMLYNLNEYQIEIIPTETKEIGGLVITPAETGTISGKISYPKIAPYLGIGWGNANRDGRSFRLAFDLGIVYLRSPMVSLSATEMLTPTAEQSGLIEENMKDYNLWLVISLGISFKLF